MSGEVARLREQLRRAIEGGAWHGPALREVVDDMDAREAAARPLPEAHAPWEILLHAVVWLETVARRLRGEDARPTPAQDWPRVPETATEVAWREAQGRVAAAHEELQRVLGDLSDEDLGRRVVGQEYDAYFMLHGLVQHTLYHAGQIAVLAKAVRGRSEIRDT